MDHKVNLNTLVKAIQADRCASEIKVDNVNGAIFKACPVAQESCSACASGWVVIKTSKAATDPKNRKLANSVVTDTEAFVTKQIYEAISSLRGTAAQVYAEHVVNYVDHYLDRSNPRLPEAAIITKLVPFKPGGPKNLREYIRSGACTQTDFCAMVVQIFTTLSAIEYKVPGFAHMDLSTAQIFLQPWPLRKGHYFLPATRGKWLILERKYWPVIGDFGTSVTKKHPEALELYAMDQYGPACLSTAQDIFRFFYDAQAVASGTRLKPFLDKLIHVIFNGRFAELRAMTDPKTMYLRNSGCEIVHGLMPYYHSVLTRSPLFHAQFFLPEKK